MSGQSRKQTMICKICDSESILFGAEEILGKYQVQYFCCTHCNFIQTEQPYWLEEAYSTAINDSDIGLVNRNLLLVERVKPVISLFFNSNERFLDYGGGYGLFVRLMRDSGFDFYRYDKYCPNLFAKSFDADFSQCRYELVTAFEVFEHLVDPMTQIRQMLQASNSILFSTTLVPLPPPRLGKWWYYGLEHGQHISLYTLKSLEVIAKYFKLNLYSNGKNLHLLTQERISPVTFRLATSRKFSALTRLLTKHRRSLLPDDYFRVTGHHLYGSKANPTK